MCRIMATMLVCYSLIPISDFFISSLVDLFLSFSMQNFIGFIFHTCKLNLAKTHSLNCIEIGSLYFVMHLFKLSIFHIIEVDSALE